MALFLIWLGLANIFKPVGKLIKNEINTFKKNYEEED
jgi:hypothetical protein